MAALRASDQELESSLELVEHGVGTQEAALASDALGNRKEIELRTDGELVGRGRF